MTHQEIYQQLNNVDQKTWTTVKELLSEYRCTARELYLKQIDLANPKPIDYFVTAVIEDDSYGRQNRQSVGYGLLGKFSIFRINTRHKNNADSFLHNLPVQFLQYLPTNITTRIRKAAREKEIESNTKQLQLNEFSYQLFKAQLQASKKKLSGTEAIAQIKKLPTPTSQSEKEFYDKFLALFWDNLPKKSVDFCEYIIGKSKHTIYSPVKIIKSDSYLSDALKETEFSQAEVHLYLYDYQRIAREYNIPVLKEFWTDRYSEHHDWVSGVPKSTPLNQVQLEMTVSQILVLDFIITNLQKDSQCPYFTKLKNHLVSEVIKPEYSEYLIKLTTQMQTSYTSALKATNGLFQLHNQISSNQST